ncbi:MAG: leucyl aminopeptidase [Cellvibrionaceae bacterium]
MKFLASHSNSSSQKADCIVVPIFDGGKLSGAASDVNKASNGAITALIKTGDITGKVGESILLHKTNNIPTDRILLVGFGHQKHCKASEFRKAILATANAVRKTQSKNAYLYLSDISVDERDENWKAQQTVQLFSQQAYIFDSLKSEKKTPSPLATITLSVEKSLLASTKKAIATASAIAEGVSLARDLGNFPGNICTPTYLAEEAKRIAKGNTNITAKILSEAQMKKLGMGSLLSVSEGSKEPAQLIVLEYTGAAKSQKPTVFVGKGITFDTGGISLKPGGGMDEMKFDMCGAASVLGAMKSISILKPKFNFVVIVAAAENMPSGEATKPGDIVTSMSGKTIEVLNTDAEGRLVLCDALTYAERFKPKAVVDVATLTGACVVALGQHASGLYSNQQPLADKLVAAGEISGDRAWQMPLWDEYKPQLESNFADLANIGGPKAGSITAACFLSYFTESYPWAHLDIAGSAWLSNADKGATGRPVPLLVNYLLENG